MLQVLIYIYAVVVKTTKKWLFPPFLIKREKLRKPGTCSIIPFSRWPALPLWRSLQGTFSTLLGSASFPAPEVAPQDLGVGGVQPSPKLRKTVTWTPLPTRLAALELRNYGPALLALGWLTRKLVRWCSPKWTCQIPDFTATHTVFSGAVSCCFDYWSFKIHFSVYRANPLLPPQEFTFYKISYSDEK